MDDSGGGAEEAGVPGPGGGHRGPVVRWLLRGGMQGPEGPEEAEGAHPRHPWWRVMCLTGVDYFSTLGYQPGIAALAAGALAPFATLVLVLLTLFGALPVYARVARESPRGEGSIAMLEHLLTYWKGKLFVLVLLGFVATDFIITITLSAADATAHIIENPFAPAFLHGRQVEVTVGLIAVLGAVFLKGFKEAIGIAVPLVASYLLLNAVVILDGLARVAMHPEVLSNWHARLFEGHGSPLAMAAFALLLFPKLALGLSGFETGVAVMPLVDGGAAKLEGRVQRTRRLLLVAASIMSVFLLTSSLVTTTLIPPDEFERGGAAYGRALAYLAHAHLGDAFGTAYDLATILILWFAGASAMAGLINIVPRYLPRFGMAPDWSRALRPLVLIYTAIAFTVTLLFRADVEAQGGAYATGVLVLMSSAAIAVTISAHRAGRRTTWAFGAIVLVFLYTTAANMIERPEGIRIAAFFIGATVAVSLVSRVTRSGELRFQGFRFRDGHSRFLWESLVDLDRDLPLVIVPHRPSRADDPNPNDLEDKELRSRAEHNLAPDALVIFVEVHVGDPSDFYNRPVMDLVRQEGRFVLRVSEAVSAAHTLAAIVLELSRRGQPPRIYFGWSDEDNPWLASLRTLLFGEGDVPALVRKLIKDAQPDPGRRPRVYVVG